MSLASGRHVMQMWHHLASNDYGNKDQNAKLKARVLPRIFPLIKGQRGNYCTFFMPGDAIQPKTSAWFFTPGILVEASPTVMIILLTSCPTSHSV